MIGLNLISIQFGIFFLFLLVIYSFMPLRFRWQTLLAGSVAFYLLSATPYTALYLVFSSGNIWFAAKQIEKIPPKKKKTVYILALAANVALLVLMKYTGGLWALGTGLFRFAGIQIPAFSLGWLAPLGISYYTLQLVGYLTDVYWGISPAEKNPAKLALFACYFPSISSGPILRFNQVEPELFGGRKASYQDITFGIQRMLWGLFKKLVIAERLAGIAQPVFGNIDAYGGLWLWIALAAAVLQVYTDFSGNMDFILGASECLGIKLPENFRQPFFSLTIQEFWQRWHISLGSWLRDYIMYPLLRSKLFAKLSGTIKKRFGKKTAKLIITFLAMLILWLVNGVWHAAYPKFIATVLWFWFAVTAGQLLEPIGTRIVKLMRIQTDCFSWRLFQRVRTVLIYAVGVLFFVSPGILDALRIGKRMLFARGFAPVPLSEIVQLVGGDHGATALGVALPVLIVVESFQNRGGSVREWLARQNLVFRWAVLLGFIFFIIIYGLYGPGYNPAEFIYAGF